MDFPGQVSHLSADRYALAAGIAPQHLNPAGGWAQKFQQHAHQSGLAGTVLEPISPNTMTSGTSRSVALSAGTFPNFFTSRCVVITSVLAPHILNTDVTPGGDAQVVE
ncbi:hypothetical protein CGERO_01315 [Corynebacterium gerontici]|uniref:Uncharacterized protein n=1 Tax=Corynebacterium gerontici TaxID=2079234 RepID=A0A3G6IY68_9CORY|nr:hypothetical protein CGERO_01315 [Corynebacterium gerontici]